MNLTKVSKYISLILRHKPEEIDITLDEHGWANVDKLVKGVDKNYPGFCIDILHSTMTILSFEQTRGTLFRLM